MNNDIKGEFGEITWQIGGQQGEGIDSTGDILASTLNQLGYYLYGYREFSSRIKGGHTNYRLRISDNPIGATSHKLHLLIALDQESLSTQNHFLVPSSIIVSDENLNVNSTKVRHNVVKAPLTRLAEGLGNRVAKNMIALGISIAIMNLRLADFEDIIKQRFSKKGSEIVTLNLAGIESGFDWACQNELLGKLPVKVGDKKKRLFMAGNQAAALGAIMAGCRFLSAYPITPATEIMEYLGRQLPDIGGAAIQTEDEIAAINMALGAGYAGARAMTSTSGPGLL